jgi:hypothetical protein
VFILVFILEQFSNDPPFNPKFIFVFPQACGVEAKLHVTIQSENGGNTQQDEATIVRNGSSSSL